MTDCRGVLVISEVIQEKITSITLELMNTGQKLCTGLKEPLDLLLIGPHLQKATHEAAALGANTVFTVNSSPFTESSPEAYLDLITDVCQRIKPWIILLGQNDMGRDIAPRLAARMDAGVCLDCIKLAVDPVTRSLHQSKPVYGGNAVAIWSSIDHRPQVISMRSRATAPYEPNPTWKSKITPIDVDVDDSKIKAKLLDTVKQEFGGIKLDEAKVIVCGGGGIGSEEGFQLLQELAQVLHGTIGISRVPCDEGWMPNQLEIGQTGHTVSPTLYIAVGISGAPQHLAGCSSSKWIVAINKDPEAHIFKIADYGIVGDYKVVLPLLIEKLKTLLAS